MKGFSAMSGHSSEFIPLQKMQGTCPVPGTLGSCEVEYYLARKAEEPIALNSWIGSQVELQFSGHIECVHCARSIKKTFGDGYCYPCFQKLAACDLCIVKPELCHYRFGTCREPAWGEANCMQKHIVYLSNTSHLKIGITRKTNVPSRFIDQGATQALPILEVSSRYLAGRVEVLFGEMISDKTHWKNMLFGDFKPLDLKNSRDELIDSLGEGLDDLEQEFGTEGIHFLENEEVITLRYPQVSDLKARINTKAKSLKLEPGKGIRDTLLGIKGQYLLFTQGVFNVRNHSGHFVEIISKGP